MIGIKILHQQEVIRNPHVGRASVNRYSEQMVTETVLRANGQTWWVSVAQYTWTPPEEFASDPRIPRFMMFNVTCRWFSHDKGSWVKLLDFFPFPKPEPNDKSVLEQAILLGIQIKDGE